MKEILLAYAYPRLDVEVSKKIDLPPILTFADIVLWNWELVNPNEPVSLDNVRFLTLFSGTETEKNFYALSLAAELKGAEMVGPEGFEPSTKGL